MADETLRHLYRDYSLRTNLVDPIPVVLFVGFCCGWQFVGRPKPARKIASQIAQLVRTESFRYLAPERARKPVAPDATF